MTPNLTPAALSALRALRDCGVVRVRGYVARYYFLVMAELAGATRVSPLRQIGVVEDYRLTEAGKKLAEEVL